jgi:hypothetical protein
MEQLNMPIPFQLFETSPQRQAKQAMRLAITLLVTMLGHLDYDDELLKVQDGMRDLDACLRRLRDQLVAMDREQRLRQFD